MRDILETSAQMTLALLALILCICASPANAAIKFQHLRSSTQVDILLIQGKFEPTDDPKLIARELDSFPTRLVSFHSSGGDQSVAMAYGRQVRGLGLTTLQVKSSTCLASCLLAYLGGVERYAEPGSIIIQPTAFAGTAGAVGMSTDADGEAVRQYLAEMGAAQELVEFASAVEPGAVRTLSEFEVRRFRIVTGAEQGNVGDNSSSEQTMSSSEAIETALEFYQQFNQVWSGSEAAVSAFLQNSYADNLLYYGKTLSATEVLAEKKTFAERWPSRIYAVRAGTAHAACSNTCSIFGVIDWYAFSSTRKKSASGSVNLALVWNPTTGKIIAETSKMVETDKNPTAPDRITRRWIVDSTNCRLSREKGTSDDASCKSQVTLETELRNAGWCSVPFDGWQRCNGN